MQICGPAGETSRATVESGRESTAPSPCFLSAHAYVCEFDDGAIILDLRSDAYLGIDAEHLNKLRTRIGNWPDAHRHDQEAERQGTSESDSLIASLISRGILTASPTSRQLSPILNPTMALTIESFAEARPRVSLTHVVQFAVALLVVVLRLRRNRLPDLVDWLRRRQSSIHRARSVTRENAARRLASFLWLRTWCYTAQRRCLFDSLILSVYLTKGLIPCTFVIGVATKPFLAHSWVQIGESVLNDTAEHVQDFKPILGLGGG
jgi:Transglutaminase-like superfamily